MHYYNAVLCMVFLSILHISLGLRCHQCSSNDHIHCSEQWISDREPEECSGLYEAQYCVKATGMFEGQIGTKRFCSSRHLGNYCDYNKRPGDGKRDYRSCMFTCWTDGCNSASTSGSKLLFFSASIILLFTLNYVYRQ